MSNTNNKYLEGSEFSNITLMAGCDGDGSLQMSGVLYTNTIKEYNTEDSGVNIEGSYFEGGKAIITSTQDVNSCASTNASLIVNGGILVHKDSKFNSIIRICNTTNSNNLSSGSLQVTGGVSINKNANIGGVITIFNTNSSINSSIGSLVSYGGISITNTNNAISYTEGGALTIAGGASIEKTLFANIIISSNASISNSIFQNITSSNSINTNLTSSNLASTNAIIYNINNTNITSNSIRNDLLTSNNSTISNLNVNTGTFGSIISTNGSISNLNSTLANINDVYFSTGNITTLTVGTLFVTENIEYNDIVTNLSSSNNVNLFSTIASLQLTTGTFGNLHGQNLYVYNSSFGQLVSNNISSNNVNIINQTVGSTIINFSTIGNSYINNTIITNLTTSNIIATNLTSTSGYITNITSSNILTSNIISSNSTFGFLLLTGDNSTRSTLIINGSTNMNSTENATSITNGGGFTNLGGGSIKKDLFVGGVIVSNIITSNSISTNNFINTYSTISNIFSDNSTFGYLILSGTIPSYNSTSGALVSYGGISINATDDVTSLTSGGGLTDAGGASIAKSLLVGGTVSATSISAGNIYVIDSYNNSQRSIFSTISNLINTNNTITNSFVVNSTVSNGIISNLTSNNITTSNLVSSNISYGNLIGNYINSNVINTDSLTSLNSTSTNSLITNSSISQLQITNGTFSNLMGSFFNTSNASISSLISSNIFTLNETTTNLLASNISTSNIIGTSANFIYATIGSLISNNINAVNLTANNLYIQGITANSVLFTNQTIENSYINNLTTNFISSGNSIIVNLTSSNNVLTNITSVSINVTNLSGSNGVFTNSSINSLFVLNQTTANLILSNGTVNNIVITNNTTTNLYASNISSSNLNSVDNIFTNVSFSNLNGSNILVTNFSNSNGIITNLSSSNSIITNILNTNSTITTANITELTAGNINFTGTLYQNGSPYISSQWTSLCSGNLAYFNTSGGIYVGINNSSPLSALDVTGNVNISFNLYVNGNANINNLTINNNLTVLNATIANISNINLTSFQISTSKIFASNGTISNLLANVLISTNSTFNNSYINNLTSTIISSNNLISLLNTFGSVYISETSPSYNSSIASFIINGGISIKTTTNAFSSTSGGGITNLGGLATLKDAYIGGNTWLSGGLDLNLNVISNVTAPNINLDVANKWYVDNRFNQFTIGNVNGNFTQGQVIIANTGGNITGYPTFIYSNSNNLLSLYGTQDATSLTNGGTLNVYGGASIVKNVYIGGNTFILGTLDVNNQKITSVATPTTFYDAANKYYVDDRFDQFTIGNVSGNFTQGQVIVANTGGNITGYSGFTFTNGTLVLSSTSNSINLTTPGTLITYGGANILKNLFVGQGIDANSQIISNVTAPSFNLDVANKWYVDNQFSLFTIGNVSGNFTQGQVIVASTGGNIIGYPSFTFNTNGTLVLSSTTNASGLNSGVLSVNGGASFNKNVYIGTGLDVNNTVITSVALPLNPSDAVNKQYVDFFLGINNGDISEKTFILNNNVNIPTNVSNFIFLNSQVSSFEAIVYLEIPTLNIYDQWEIHGVLKGSIWIINTKFIGDHPSRIVFSIINTGTAGQIQYTNNNSGGVATIRFRASTTSQGSYTNITVGNNLIRDVVYGGTGQAFFTSGTLLVGNGIDPISTSLDLMYFNNTLFLNSTSLATSISSGAMIIKGGVSIQKSLFVGQGIDVNQQLITNVTAPSVNLDVANKWYVDSKFGSGGSLNLSGQVSFSNTVDATNASTGGTLTVLGGTGIAKKLYIGTQLFVQNINMTPSLGDLFYEQSFSANNNQSSPSNITGFLFNNTIVRFFHAIVSVNIITSFTSINTGFELKGIQLNGPTWSLNSTFIGNNSNVVFNITTNGQIQYTSKNIPNWLSTTIKFRSLTTSV